MSNSLTLGKKALTLVVVSATILWTLGVAAFAVPQTASAAAPGSVIKGTSLSTVYYYGTDGQRYTFPNSKTYFTWYEDFAGVMTISDSELAAIPLAGNVVYRPGSRWVKIQSDPKTYAVTPNGSLRWIESEAVAVGLGGSAWNTLIDDVAEVFFVDYTVGSSLMTAAAYEGMYATMGGNNYVVVGGEKRMVTAAGSSANRVQARFYLTSGSDLLSSLTAGADVTSKLNVLADPAQLGDSDVTPVAGGLTVSLASSTPAATTIADGASQVRFMNFNLTANGGDATVTSLTVKMAGLGVTGNISSLYLFDGNTRLTNARTVNSTTRQAIFGGLTLKVTNGETRMITVVGDMTNGVTGGDTIQFQLEGASGVVSNATVGGSFPVTGNVMTTSATDVGLVTIADTGSLSNPSVGEVAKIANFRLTANSTEGFKLHRLRMEVDRAADHSMFELRQNNVKLADGVVSGTYVDFNLVTPFEIAQGNNREFDVYAKVGGENAEIIKVRVEETTDLYAVGLKYGFGIRVTNNFGAALATTCTGDGTNYDCTTIQAGQLTFAFNGPTTGDIAENKVGVVVWEGTITAENMVEVRALEFDVNPSAGATSDLCSDACGTASSTHNYQNWRLVNKTTGSTISGPYDMTINTTEVDAATGGIGTISMTDDFTIPAGESWDVQVLTDVQDDASFDEITAGDALVVALDSSETSARDSDNNTMTVGTDIIPSSDLTGNSQTVRTSSLSVSIASNPASATYVRGTSNVDIAGFAFAAGTASEVTVSAVTFKGVMDADGGPSAAGDLTVQNAVSSCSIYDGSTGALIDGPESFGTGTAADITFSGFTWEIPAASTYRMVVRCNLANLAVSGAADSLYLEIDEDDDVTTVDGDGNSIAETTGGTVISSSNEVNDDGATVFQTIANAGTITTAVDGDSPNSTIVLGNSTGVTVSKFKFTSSNEAFTVDRLAVSNTGGSDVAVSSVELHYQNQAGEDKVATGFLTSNVYTFEGLTFYVPKDDDAVLTVKINTGDVTASNSASGDVVGIDLDIDTTGDDQFRAVGMGSGATLDDDDAGADRAGNDMEIRKTKPTISLASGSPSGAAIVGLIEVLRFNVTADSRGDVTVNEFTFEVNATDNVPTGWDECDTGDIEAADIYLYDSSDLSDDLALDGDITLAQTSGAACGAGSDLRWINIDFTTAEEVAAGTTKTYILKMNVNNTTSPSAVQDDSLRVDFPDENAHDAASTTDYDVIAWSDSNTSGTDGDDDGGSIDGEYIKNLPIIGGSLIF